MHANTAEAVENYGSCYQLKRRGFLGSLSPRHTAGYRGFKKGLVHMSIELRSQDAVSPVTRASVRTAPRGDYPKMRSNKNC